MTKILLCLYCMTGTTLDQVKTPKEPNEIVLPDTAPIPIPRPERDDE